MVPREAASGAASPGAARPGGAISENPRFSRRERCVPRLARAIRRANRAGADTRPRPRRIRAEKGPPLPVGRRRDHDRNRPPPRTGGDAGRRAGARRRSPRRSLCRGHGRRAAAAGRPRACRTPPRRPRPTLHLRQLLAVLDWAGAHLPEPEPAPVEEPEEEPWEPPPAVMSPITTAARTSSTMAARPMSAARKRPSSRRGWKTWSAASGRSRSTTAARAA